MKLWTASLLLAPGAALAAPVPMDFARGLPLEAAEPAPAYEVVLPDAAYRGATRRDLGDLRVFDARGRVVQHALCPAESPAPQRVRNDADLWALPPGGRPARREGARVEVQTAEGARLTLAEGESEAEQAGGAYEYLLDARAIDAPLAAIDLAWEWRTPQGRAELDVRVAASQDLDDWQTIVPGATLLRAEGAGGALERSRLELPQRRYRFLRLTPKNERARDWLHGATLVSLLPADAGSALRWFDAEPLPTEQTAVREYRSAPRAPVQGLRLEAGALHLGARISTRDASGAPWRPRAAVPQHPEGHTGGNPLVLEPPVTARFWRVAVTQGAEALGDRALTLRMGYAPARLRFLAQGEGPWLLAYGSAQAPPAEALACARFERVSRAVSIGGERRLGGDSRLSQEAGWPLRRIVLWAVLAAGALLVVTMALYLLRRLRDED